ncbi:MAG TPA: glycosyltransferase [Steroidobacter sp.]
MTKQSDQQIGLRRCAARIGRIGRLAVATQVMSLIRGARAVLFPSLYEGFGLPILESMLLGTPVLTSRTSAVPEVAGNAALMANPYDTREIAEGIWTLERDDSLCDELSERGSMRAAAFSEAAYRQRIAAVYEKVRRTHAA